METRSWVVAGVLAAGAAAAVFGFFGDGLALRRGARWLLGGAPTTDEVVEANLGLAEQNAALLEEELEALGAATRQERDRTLARAETEASVAVGALEPARAARALLRKRLLALEHDGDTALADVERLPRVPALALRRKLVVDRILAVVNEGLEGLQRELDAAEAVAEA